MGTIADFKKEIIDLRAALLFERSFRETFFTGNVPENATLEHMLIAQAGRERLERLKKQPALLRKEDIKIE